MSENIVKETFSPHLELIDNTPVLIKDEYGNYESLEKYMGAPTRVRLNETLSLFSSFIDAISTRFSKEDAAIYAAEIPCVFTGEQVRSNYDKFSLFGFNGIANDCRKTPQWRDDFQFKFRGRFTVSARDWLKFDEFMFPQEKFALFLEKHIDDIACVDGQVTQMELYNFVTTLEDSKSDRFSRKVNIQNGDISVSLERESDDGTKQRLKLFKSFAIHLQLFEGFPTYQVNAALRFRVSDGQVRFWYDLEGLEGIFNASRDWAVNELKEKTGLPVYI